MRKQITSCLWFDNQAKEAASYYTAHFEGARILSQTDIVTGLEVSGHNFTFLNGGPMYKPNPSISFFYICETDQEITRLWDAFSKEGVILMALDQYDWSEKYGWLNDKYGISWQFALGDVKEVGQKITPCLMFAGGQYGRAEEAINHYSSIFKNAEVDGILRYNNNEAPDMEGKVKHAQIALSGSKFMFMESAANHNFQFTEGVSLMIHCDTQNEIDYYWNRLSEDGEESMCGWLKDKFGVSWQVLPSILGKLMTDPVKAPKAAKAFMQMRKMDIEKIVQASES
jgi:predicted 3-demethylubiquinone-9 3-methyltransferase (glyoxalase superfamily)